MAKNTTAIFREAYELLHRYDSRQANKLWDEYYNAMELEFQKEREERQATHERCMKALNGGTQ